ncbi:MAG TPA: glutathione S-transferase N-terminal domain-containing protein [Alphaproteobacteria bacterium]
MIDLYAWPTPNAFKVSIMLEETGTPYRVFAVDITKGDQFKADFLKMNPNNKMPVIVDSDGPDGQPITIFESGAILLYLAEKTGRFIPRDVRGRYAVTQWLMFQMASIGPMLGQVHHFRVYAPEPIPYAVERYTNEARRLYNVLDRRLGEVSYLAGDYSIADMAVFPWIRPYKRQGLDINDFPNLKRWFDAIDERPAVQRGLTLLADRRREGPIDDKAREVLFGATQYAKR